MLTIKFLITAIAFIRTLLRFSLANRGYDLRLIQDYPEDRDPKHTVHYTRVAAGRFEGL